MDKNTAELDATIRTIGNFTVGFLKLEKASGAEDAIAAGSGTLVSYGGVQGILTAAHVLKNLPDKGEVGLVRFPNVSTFLQRQTIDMAETENVTICGNGFGPSGPDIGILRLPAKNVGNLGATNVFFNMGIRRDAVLSLTEQAPPYYDAVVGVIAERSKELPPKPPLHRMKGIEALFGVGNIVNSHNANGFDLVKFELTYDSDYKSPSTYQGMSGGALWRVYCDKNGGSVREKILRGVVFYESPNANGELTLTCHGPRSIYGDLIKKMQEKWPVQAREQSKLGE